MIRGIPDAQFMQILSFANKLPYIEVVSKWCQNIRRTSFLGEVRSQNVHSPPQKNKKENTVGFITLKAVSSIAPGFLVLVSPQVLGR